MSHSAPTRTTELPTKSLRGHALRRVQKLNGTLRKTRRLVKRSGVDPQQSLALLVAETRVLVLRMGRYEFGQLANMHFQAVKNVETPGSQPQHESLSRVYREWKRLADAGERYAPTSIQTRKRLEEAAAKLLDLLVPQEDDYGRSLRNTVDGLYCEWMYQVGRDAFEKASMRTNRQHHPLTYGALWQRREMQMVPDSEEVRIIARTLEREIEEAAAIWSQQKTRQLVDRGVAPPLVRLIVAIQQKHDGLRMTAASFRKHCGVSLKVAQAIKNGQMVSFDEIRQVADTVISQRERSSFVKQWNAARQPPEEDFSKAFPRICAENGWSNHMIARLLRVRAPERRSHGAGSTKRNNEAVRAEAYRPAAEVRRMYQGNAFSAQAPAEAAIELIARDNAIVNEQGETQKDYLKRLFLKGVDQQLRQKGSGAQGSTLRMHRVLCGVTPEQLAELSGENKNELLLVERGLRRISSSKEKRLIGLMQQLPQRKVDEARSELARLTAAPKTVMESVTLLKKRHGGYIPLSRLLHDDEDRRFSFTPVRLKRIAAGIEVPPLPLLKSLVTRGGSEVTPELVRGWYLQMPSYLAVHPKLQWRHPLARGFGIVVFENWSSLYQFWKEHFEGDFSHSVLTRNFQQMNGRGYDVAWPTVSRYLNAAGVGIHDPRRLFFQRLFHRKDKIAAAIQAENDGAGRRVIRDVLLLWQQEVRANGGDPAAVEHRLGLTPQEHRAKGSAAAD